MTFDLDAYLEHRRQLVEEALDRHLIAIADDDVPPTLAEAMRYSLLGGGKRLRPILTLAACEIVGGRLELAIDAACAIEMVHTYSLIHDDLPAMDNDDFRRGRPTSHKKFGEAVAILAGDALLTDSFRVLASSRQGREARVAEVLFELARAAGAAGMVGGQVADLEATGHRLPLEHLEAVHRAKTGELMLVAVRAGASLGGGGWSDLDRLSTYGRALGLAFQIVDDVLDVTADLKTLGKDPGSDRAAGKTTFVDLLGVERARARARDVMMRGLAALAPYGDRAIPLTALATFTVERDR